MEYQHTPTETLLVRIIGATATAIWYRGALRPLFEIVIDTVPYEIEPLLAGHELVRRLLCEELKARDILSSPKAVRDYLKLHFAGRTYESFVALFLDVKNRLISAEEIFRGTLTQTSVYPREIVKQALSVNCAGVIFAHNHPSGDAEPSAADITLTQVLKQTLALVDVRVLDNMVVAGTAVMSFAERGMV